VEGKVQEMNATPKQYPSNAASTHFKLNKKGDLGRESKLSEMHTGRESLQYLI
jgi:hypothetical protein